MKARKSQWFNIEDMKEKYGIQVYFEGKWLNSAEGNQALIYDSEKARDEKLQALKDEG